MHTPFLECQAWFKNQDNDILEDAGLDEDKLGHWSPLCIDLTEIVNFNPTLNLKNTTIRLRHDDVGFTLKISYEKFKELMIASTSIEIRPPLK